jgi:hypothetical protein
MLGTLDAFEQNRLQSQRLLPSEIGMALGRSLRARLFYC